MNTALPCPEAPSVFLAVRNDSDDSRWNSLSAPSVVELQPSARSLPALLQNASAAFTRNDLAAARDALRLAAEASPHLADLHQSLASVYFILGEHAESTDAFLRATILQPDDPSLFYQLAAAAIQAGRVEMFEHALQRVFELDPGNRAALWLLTNLNFQAGRFLDAARTCSAILAQTSDDLDAFLILGKCFFKLGDIATAREAYERVVQLQPGHSVAVEALGILDSPAALAQTGTPNIFFRPGPLSPEVQKRLERISCPYCGSRDAVAFRRGADIVRCAGCDIVYLRTRQKTEILEQIYQTYADDGSHMALPKNRAQADASELKRDYFLKEILVFTQPVGRLLDVGCGWGAFLLNARNHGFEPLGLELTRKAVCYANDELGIPVVNTQFLDTPYDPKSLQVVTMNHVLEHLPQPREAVAKVFRTLKPGGLFCGIVPNVDSFCSVIQREQWFWLDPNYHYVHYSPATLRRHLEAAGFKIERIYTAKGDYCPDRLHAAACSVSPELSDAVAFDSWLQKNDAEGHGEEIRFFARRPE